MAESINFKQKLNLPDNMNHHEKYGKIINFLGYEEVKNCIPFTHKQIKKAIQTDEHLNNLPLEKWDRASGFNTRNGNCIYIGSSLTRLFLNHGVNTFSSSDGVCILKECARMWAEENL